MNEIKNDGGRDDGNDYYYFVLNTIKTMETFEGRGWENRKRTKITHERIK